MILINGETNTIALMIILWCFFSGVLSLGNLLILLTETVVKFIMKKAINSKPNRS